MTNQFATDHQRQPACLALFEATRNLRVAPFTSGGSTAATKGNAMRYGSAALLDARMRERESEAREFRLALRIGFGAFLLVGIASRLLPRRIRPQPFVGGPGSSLIKEAWAAANTIVPLAYMR